MTYYILAPNVSYILEPNSYNDFWNSIKLHFNLEGMYLEGLKCHEKASKFGKILAENLIVISNTSCHPCT